jgi:hypothetical protein
VKYTDIVKDIAIELDISPELVRRVYKSYWRFIKDKVQSLPLQENLTKQEFEALNTSFSIPYIGKLYCDYDKLVRKKEKYLKNLEKSNDTKKD